MNNAGTRGSLLECSPLMVATLDDSLDGGFSIIQWGESTQDPDSLSIVSPDINAWIHGPKKIIDSLTNKFGGDKILVNNMILAFIKSNNEQEKEEIRKKLASKIAEIMGACNSFSFPTFQLELGSPMVNKVPFNVNPVRMKISGVIESADKHENDVHIVVARADYEKKYLNFQRVWDKIKPYKTLI
eukprot:gene25112-32752_t